MLHACFAGPCGRRGRYPGDCPPPGRSCVGEPIILPFRNVYEKVTDFTTGGQSPLAVTRQFNGAFKVASSSFGNWRWSFDSYLAITLPSEIDAFRPDGEQVIFSPDGKGGWKGSGSTWTVTDWGDNVETYTIVNSGFTGILTSIKARGGYTQTLHYTANPNPVFPPLG